MRGAYDAKGNASGRGSVDHACRQILRNVATLPSTAENTCRRHRLRALSCQARGPRVGTTGRAWRQLAAPSSCSRPPRMRAMRGSSLCGGLLYAADASRAPVYKMGSRRMGLCKLQYTIFLPPFVGKHPYGCCATTIPRPWGEKVRRDLGALWRGLITHRVRLDLGVAAG